MARLPEFDLGKILRRIDRAQHRLDTNIKLNYAFAFGFFTAGVVVEKVSGVNINIGGAEIPVIQNAFYLASSFNALGAHLRSERRFSLTGLRNMVERSSKLSPTLAS